MALMFEKRFAPFFWTQFLGAFTDNAFKQALVLMITFRSTMSEAEIGVLIAVASGLFIVPFFLFSPLAGQISDKFEKASVMRRVKLLEILIMILAAIGFAMAGAGVSWANTYLIAILFLMGTQSTFFGPVKYSIIPQHLRDEELMEGTALVESGTFVAILTGTIGGGFLVMQSVYFVGASLICLAVVGWLSSRAIPFAPPSDPTLEIRWNWLHEYGNLYRVSNQKQSVFLAIIGISWFWFLGAMVMAQLPNYVMLFLRGDESVYILFLSLFTLSIAVGSVFTKWLSDTSVELGMVPFGVIGLTIFPLDIGLLDYSKLAQTTEATLTLHAMLANGADPLIYRVIVDVCAMGIAGSFFIVPLYALLQHRTAPQTRSQVIAANNVAGALFMVVSALVVSALYASDFDTAQLFLVLAALNSATGIYLVAAHPEFVLRLGSWLLSITRYHIRYAGRRNVPHEGPCLLYSNEIGLLDCSIITAACERPVRFVSATTGRGGVPAKALRGWLGAIVVDMDGDSVSIASATAEIDQALSAGEAVCLFAGERAEGPALPGSLTALLESALARTPVPCLPVALHREDASHEPRVNSPWRPSIEVTIGEAREVRSLTALGTAARQLLADA